MNEKTSFYLLTDSHYVSPKIWVEGDPMTHRERGDQIALKATPQILDAFFEKILADHETDTVVFLGDNVNNGDMQSHEDFRSSLHRLITAGKKVYLVCATHDYCGAGDDENFFMSCRYTETGSEPIPFMRKHELFDYYYEFGPKQALSVHKESGSYTVQLGPGVRLIMISDNGNGRSFCGLFEDGVQWLKTQIAEAKNTGNLILLAVHHPVLPPWEVFRHMADFELYGGYRELWKLMCDTDVRVVFTGHTHVQNIRKYTDENGRWFCDVSTIALANAAGKMRKITVDPQTGTCEIRSVGIDKIQGLDTAGKSVYSYLYALNFPGILEQLIPLCLQDYHAFLALADGFLPVDQLKKFKLPVKAACKKLTRMKISSIAKFGKVWRTLSPQQRVQAKSELALDLVFEMLRHIYTGNAPFPPETLENRIITAAAIRLDVFVKKFHIKKVQDLIPPGSSLSEMVQDFLYNNRTGDDDSICLQLI